MFIEVSPEEMIKSEWLDKYYAERKALVDELIALNTMLFLMKRIFEFPFTLLGYYEKPFWNLTMKGYLDSSIMIIWKILLDEHGSREGIPTHTLPKFYNKVWKNLRPEIDSSVREAFINAVNQVGHKKRIAEYKPKFDSIRSNYLAHFDYKGNVIPNDFIPSIPFSTLQGAADLASELFTTLCFGSQYMLILGNYNESAASKEITDIDELLLLLAKNSDVLKMPEDQSWLWDEYRKRYTPREIEIINTYREKIGRSKVG